MNVLARNVLIGTGVVAGAAGIAGLIALGKRNGEERHERMEVTETPFEKLGRFGNSDWDTNKDGRIDRQTEVLRFSEGGLKTGPSYASIRAIADAADMVVGNRDGFMTDAEYQDLARTYTVREGAIGLTGRESSVFAEDYGVRMGDGGSVAEMQGNPYF